MSNATTDLFPRLAFGFQEVLGTCSPASCGASPEAAAAAETVAEHPLVWRHDDSGHTIVQPRPPPQPTPSAPSCCQLSHRLMFLLLLQPPPSSPPPPLPHSPHKDLLARRRCQMEALELDRDEASPYKIMEGWSGWCGC